MRQSCFQGKCGRVVKVDLVTEVSLRDSALWFTQGSSFQYLPQVSQFHIIKNDYFLMW